MRSKQSEALRGDTMEDLVPAHGGSLTPLMVRPEECDEATRRASTLPQVPVSTKEAADLIMLATGSFSPLAGFMNRDDYLLVVDDMRLSTGVMWPIPVTLAVTKRQASSIRVGDEVALSDRETSLPLALMQVEDVFAYDKRAEAISVFGTDDTEHPGVRKLMEQNEMYVGGTVRVLTEGEYPERFPEFARPAETRETFAAMGWSTVAAFQTRNPMHRSHEYLAKIALEVCDGLFVHPIVGKLKKGDIPADVRMDCYRVLLRQYFPHDRVVLHVYPMEMRYAGPREALLHAIIRQNFGCSHLIVGRDHAGVGSYYGPFDAQKIFDTLSPGDLHIQPLKLDWTFWCYKCDAMASMKTCPHEKEDRLLISGSMLREMLSRGETPPEHFSRPEVIEILLKYYETKKGPE